MLQKLNLVNKDCVEVGVLKGEFSQSIFDCGVRTLFLVDLWCSQDESIYLDHHNHDNETFQRYYMEVIKRFRRAPNVELVRMSSSTASNYLPKVDFVYLDANTSYEARLNDLLLWSKKIKKGGWLCSHDYPRGSSRVEDAVKEFLRISGLTVDVCSSEETWASCGIQIQ